MWLVIEVGGWVSGVWGVEWMLHLRTDVLFVVAALTIICGMHES